MAASSHHHQLSFFLDHAYLPNTSLEIPLQADSFPCYFPSQSIHESSCLTSPVVEEEKVQKPQNSSEKKRKSSEGSCLTSNQTKDSKGSRTRKQKKANDDSKETEEKKLKVGEVEEEKACEEPPKEYIHVRARRGQATDSHSLAERVRREKISLRFKVLQGLVPGCDKVTGKALMLDEIINYVQSLQNQVEFLSMKLASVNPMLYDFSADFDDFLNQSDKMGAMSQLLPSVSQTSHTVPTAFEEATNNYPMMAISRPILLNGQGPTTMSQDNSSFLVQMGDQRQGFLNQVEFNNMSSFQ